LSHHRERCAAKPPLLALRGNVNALMNDVRSRSAESDRGGRHGHRDYRGCWNLDVDGSLWIIAPNSINEVGCIHTCQGLEVDYIGVIIGPDFVVRDGQVVTVPKARDRHDKTLRGYGVRFKADPKKAAAEADLIIKNTYRTLMTRGMKGCYVYCSDEETASYFRARLSPLATLT
jgi:hypothetical protein